MKRMIRSSYDLHERVQEGLKRRRNDVFTPEDKDALRRVNERIAREEARLKENSESVTSSYDPTEADLYVVKIWYEVDPGHDTVGPEAAEEIIQTVASSPDKALEQAKRAWNGPIDRIEIVDINPSEYVPDYDDEKPPFEFDYSDAHLPYENYEAPVGGSSVVASSKFDNSPAREASELIRFLNDEGVDEHTFVEFFYDNIPAADMIKMLKQLADECDIDLDEFYN